MKKMVKTNKISDRKLAGINEITHSSNDFKKAPPNVRKVIRYPKEPPFRTTPPNLGKPRNDSRKIPPDIKKRLSDQVERIWRKKRLSDQVERIWRKKRLSDHVGIARELKPRKLKKHKNILDDLTDNWYFLR